MIIKNGLVWEESGSFRKKELVVDTTTHRIAETAEDDTVFDAEGLYVIPGLVDIRVHIDALPSSNADLMLDTTFESAEALKGYSKHPAHVAVADSKVRPYYKSRVCLDYEV